MKTEIPEIAFHYGETTGESAMYSIEPAYAIGGTAVELYARHAEAGSIPLVPGRSQNIRERELG